jgi:hypothetical protein
VRDLTEKQRAALEREQLYTKAQEANRLKDEFLGTVSHELRTRVLSKNSIEASAAAGMDDRRLA